MVALVGGGGSRIENCDSEKSTYDISPKGRNASFNVCVSISGLRSPTNMW
jgi:hypothetical protein